MEKLFLLDAYALIYRAYYAFIKNPRINSKGFNTSAILGFVNTLEDVLKKEKPSHIGIAFDPKGPTFRHEAYEAYKAQREDTPEVIRESVPVIKEFIKAYNIPILEVSGFEADDVIGTLAKQAEKKGIVTYMMTQVFTLFVTFGVALFNKDLMNLFFTTEMINLDMINLIIYLAIIVYTITLVIGYVVNTKLFQKGVNVD